MSDSHPTWSPAEIPYSRHADLLVLHRSYQPRFELLTRMRGELRAGLLLAGFSEGTIERCVLVVNELLTNSIKASRPGKDEVDVIAYRTVNGDLLVEVYDSATERADDARTTPHHDEESGRGLPLCDLLCKGPVEQFSLEDGKVTVAVLAA